MTVREFKVAQAMTQRPVKGMLTGPVTVLNWSFPRNDVSRSTTAFQLAVALREEVADLEKAGCRIIQVGSTKGYCHSVRQRKRDVPPYLLR
jgi:5-methyltetrahydropteroyltriglutamate--homocysteine methyltransferase